MKTWDWVIRVNRYHDESLSENRVDIYYGKEDQQIKALFDFLNEGQRLIGTYEGIDKLIVPNEVLYFEAVERRCFAYLENEVYEVEGSLQSLEKQYTHLGFIRVNKSTVLNILRISQMKACINMRVLAQLENGENIIISRSYKKNFGKRLREMCKEEGEK